MTKLADYLDHLPPSRTYTEAELQALQTIFDRARDRLQLSDSDPKRVRLAILLLELAATNTITSPTVLLERVVLAFRMP